MARLQFKTTAPFLAFAAQFIFVAGLIAQPYAYVANMGGNNVSLVNTANNTLLFRLIVPAGPTGIAMSPDKSTVYVACKTAKAIAVINTATNTLASTIALSTAPSQVVFNPSGTQVYAISPLSNLVTIIDTTSRSVVGTITVGASPASVAFNPAGTMAYVSNVAAHSVSVIDTVRIGDLDVQHRRGTQRNCRLAGRNSRLGDKSVGKYCHCP